MGNVFKRCVVCVRILRRGTISMKDLIPRYWIAFKGKGRELIPDDEEGLSAEDAINLRSTLINEGYTENSVVIVGVYESKRKTTTINDI